MEAPEKIYINPEWSFSWRTDKMFSENVEYIRADLMPRWISVKERLPEMGTYIVAVSDVPDFGRRWDVAFYNDQTKGWGTFSLHNWAGGEITHWQEFPELPKEGE